MLAEVGISVEASDQSSVETKANGSTSSDSNMTSLKNNLALGGTQGLYCSSLIILLRNKDTLILNKLIVSLTSVKLILRDI